MVVSIIYIPLTVYGTFKELRENSNLYVAVYNLIKNYFFVGEQFYSWQLWYLLATIFGMEVLLLVPHKHWHELLLYSCAFFALAYVINCFQGTRIIKLTIVNGRLFTRPSYILLGMLVKREHKPLSRSGGIIAPILACFCSVLLKIPYSTTNIVAFLSVPWILGIVMKYSKNCYQVGVSKECREISSIIYFSHMYFFFVWMYLLPIREKGVECFMFVSGTSFFVFCGVLSDEKENML